jgi:hypothetical protein
MFFPGNLKRAKAYATKELEKRVAITPLTVMSVVFSAYLIMGGIPPTILEEPP